MRIILTLLLILVFFGSLILGKIYRLVPVKELRRRARSGRNSPAEAIYKMASYGASAEAFLWLIGSLSAAALILMAANQGWWLVLLLVLAMAWLVLFAGFGRQTRGWSWRLAGWLAAAVATILYYLQPLVGRLAKRRPGRKPTGLYEREDLLQLLKDQYRLIDNRISEPDLKIAFHALTFSDKTVGQAMTPIKVVKMVAAGESIGPHLMDELHDSGLSRFPVVKDSSKTAAPQIIGTFYIRDLVGYGGSGKVRDLMKPDVYFINEAANLHQALDAFLKTHHHLLVVVNNFEELVGIISLEDVLEQILGQKITGEFDRYDDLRAVAGHQAEKEHNQHDTHTA